MTTDVRKRTVDTHRRIAAAITNRLGLMDLMIAVATSQPGRMDRATAAIANHQGRTDLMVEDNARTRVRLTQALLR